MMHENIRASLITFMNDCIDEAKLQGHSDNLGFLDLDDHVNIAEYPKTDLLALHGFSYQDMEGWFEIDVNFAVMVLDDRNLFRHHKLLGMLQKKLRPGGRIDLINAQTAGYERWMIIQPPVSLTPMARAETRPVQFFNVNLAVASLQHD